VAIVLSIELVQLVQMQTLMITKSGFHRPHLLRLTHD
jgi:hypothetical protein